MERGARRAMTRLAPGSRLTAPAARIHAWRLPTAEARGRRRRQGALAGADAGILWPLEHARARHARRSKRGRGERSTPRRPATRSLTCNSSTAARVAVPGRSIPAVAGVAPCLWCPNLRAPTSRGPRQLPCVFAAGIPRLPANHHHNTVLPACPEASCAPPIYPRPPPWNSSSRGRPQQPCP